MKATFRVPRSGMALSVLLCGAALFGAPGAFGADPAHPAAGELKLSNVRAVAATPAQLAEVARSSTAASEGMRAYKDPVTGELRDQTPEEMLESAAGNAKSFRQHAPKAMTRSPRGGISIELDDSFLTNAVVTRDAGGKLHLQCVTGEKASLRAVLEGNAGKGHSHDH